MSDYLAFPFFSIILAILVFWIVVPLLLNFNFGYVYMIAYFACLLGLCCAFVERFS